MKLNIENTLHDAQSLSKRGDEQAARELLQELLAVEPDNQAALLMLGGSYFCEGMLQEAEIVFERLVLAEPGNGKYSVALFNTLWKLTRAEEALEEIKRFLSVANKEQERETVDQYMKIVKELEGSASAND